MFSYPARFCIIWLPLAVCVFLAPLGVPAFVPSVQIGGISLAVSGEAQAASKKTKKKKKATKKSRAPSVPQTEGPRWAAMVVDADTGDVLYEKNAERTRYPASLTKILTLYLLFEAMENKRYTMNSWLDISARAASQPQTNISLKAGDRLQVRTAIDALIIRSANDVAMAVAENLGGSQEGFARMMNRKARELGMSGSRFFNPSGLPDERQITTAADMARLGIAIRRDFPEYYSLFKKSSFRYNGRTYTTHNRVVGRYPGADGLKTGYIRASGFNLVTSVVRGDSKLVGVILGGYSSSSRDQEMMNMLDKVYFSLASGSADRKAIASSKASAPATASAEARKPVPQVIKIPTTKSPFQPPTVAESYTSDTNWGVQVGAFPTIEQVHRAADNARRITPNTLNQASLQVSQTSVGQQVYNRARFMGMSAQSAKRACEELAQAHKQCMVIRAE